MRRPIHRGDGAAAHHEGDSHIGFHDGQGRFASAADDRFVLRPRGRPVSWNHEKLRAIQRRDACQCGVPAVIANQNAAAAQRRVERAAPLAESVEPPTRVIAFIELHFLIRSADLAAVVEEDRGIENTIEAGRVYHVRIGLVPCCRVPAKMMAVGREAALA